MEYSVLIIDDDIWMQRILSKTLHAYGFKTSYLAGNGFDGVAQAVEHVPTLIILDILMPELSGHLTLKLLKTIKQTKHIPVVMVSALSDIENLGMAVKSGTAGFISKPFTRATVYDKLIDIFSREKLDKIAKGIPISEEDLFFINEPNVSKIYDSSMSSDPVQETSVLEAVQTDNNDNTEQLSKSAVQSDQLLKHYQDDEKKSIESIKKLLLKTRK